MYTMRFRGFGLGGDALVEAWKESFEVKIDGVNVRSRTSSRGDAYETRQHLGVGAAERQEESE